MAWFWSYGRDVDAAVAPTSTQGADETALPDRSEDFPAQADAETWLGQEYAALLESGIENVTLFEDDREVYGPMSLRP